MSRGCSYPKHLTVRLSEDTRARLKEVADDRDLSVSDLVRKIIEDRLGE